MAGPGSARSACPSAALTWIGQRPPLAVAHTSSFVAFAFLWAGALFSVDVGAVPARAAVVDQDDRLLGPSEQQDQPQQEAPSESESEEGAEPAPEHSEDSPEQGEAEQGEAEQEESEQEESEQEGNEGSEESEQETSEGSEENSPSDPPEEQPAEQPEEQPAEPPPPEPPALVPDPEVQPPRFGAPRPDYRSTPGADGLPTRLHTDDGVTTLSNRDQAGALEQAPPAADDSPTNEGDPESGNADSEADEDDEALQLAAGSSNFSKRSSRRRESDDSGGLGWLWFPVAAAGLLLFPIGVLLNRGARRSIPPSRER